MAMTLTCPMCRARTDANRWLIHGYSKEVLTVYQGKIYDEESHPIVFEGATCPVCRTYIEFFSDLKLDNYEGPEMLYNRVREELEDPAFEELRTFRNMRRRCVA